MFKTDAQKVVLSRCIPEPNSGCWLWLGTVKENNYGYAPAGVRGRTRLAHRMSYEAFVGAIPEGLHIDHRCRTRVCVNPAHLEPVTQRENNRRSPGGWTKLAALNGAKTTCKNGHPFDALNTRHRPGGGRACRGCEQETRRRRPEGWRRVAD